MLDGADKDRDKEVSLTTVNVPALGAPGTPGLRNVSLQPSAVQLHIYTSLVATEEPTLVPATVFAPSTPTLKMDCTELGQISTSARCKMSIPSTRLISTLIA